MKELHLFDLDGTLYDTPKPPNVTWYFYLKSFADPGLPGFDPRWKTDVIVQARRSAQNPRAVTILVSGRPDYLAMRKHIAQMMKNAAIDFSALWLKPLSWNMSIPEYKAKVIEQYLHSDPTIRSVHVWDDDLKNHAMMRRLVESTKLAYVQHYP